MGLSPCCHSDLGFAYLYDGSHDSKDYETCSCFHQSGCFFAGAFSSSKSLESEKWTYFCDHLCGVVGIHLSFENSCDVSRKIPWMIEILICSCLHDPITNAHPLSTSVCHHCSVTTNYSDCYSLYQNVDRLSKLNVVATTTTASAGCAQVVGFGAHHFGNRFRW